MPMKNIVCIAEGYRESTMVNKNFRLKELRKPHCLLVHGRQRGVDQKVMPALVNIYSTWLPKEHFININEKEGLKATEFDFRMRVASFHGKIRNVYLKA
ncbi:MAG: hypothetical protein CMC87_15120 [Flavobacteriaceae bacterium]|uniref:Uncharacterized protein n=1 Tax=Mesonia oceanica TaxID=2687242 RepID=A0AC61Y6A6_9FLAO|nr:hypothetical protein [Flavobacteriaceae bacterium]VVU99724.1 hypothetical protein FVB9532_00981 [Mesonia oceanica]